MFIVLIFLPLISVDGDSDSLSECRALSPIKSPANHDISFKLNGSAHSFTVQQSTSGCSRFNKSQHCTNGCSAAHQCSASASQSNGLHNNHQSYGSAPSSSKSNDHQYNQHHYNNHQQHSDYSTNTFCDTNVYKDVDAPANGGQGSPLRSQLGLKLKTNNTPAIKTANKAPNICQVGGRGFYSAHRISQSILGCQSSQPVYFEADPITK